MIEITNINEKLDSISRLLENLDSKDNYNKDYSLDLHAQIISILEKISLLSPLVLAHEEYMRKIDKIALHDPDKTIANMKFLNERMDQIEKVCHINFDEKSGFYAQLRNLQKEIDNIRLYEIESRAFIDGLKEAYNADTQVAKDIIFERAKQNEFIRELQSENDTHCGAIIVLEKQVKELMDNMKQAEAHIYSAGDISAIHGQLDNIMKNDEFTNNNMNNLLIRIKTIEDFINQNYQVDIAEFYKLNSKVSNENTLISQKLVGVEQALSNYRKYKTSIEDLETDVMYLKEIINKIPDFKETDHDERIHDLENISAESRLIRIESIIRDNHGLIERVGILGTALHELSEENNKLMKKPHKCPVCNGLTLLARKYIDESVGENTNLPPALCLACNGKGILWH